MSRILSVARLSLLIAAGAASAGCSPEGAESGNPPAAAAPGAAKEALCKHEVADKFCPLCHPEIRNDPNILLCKEHDNIPEDICTACHPELKAKYKVCQHELPLLICKACATATGSAKPAHGSSPK